MCLNGVRLAHRKRLQIYSIGNEFAARVQLLPFDPNPSKAQVYGKKKPGSSVPVPVPVKSYLLWLIDRWL